jgi:DNA replication protein DnaC
MRKLDETFYPEFECDKCEDTGYVWDLEERKSIKCECFQRRQIKDRLKACGITEDKHNLTLDKFEIYEDDPTLINAKALSRLYIDNFNDTNNWLAFIGQHGSGKTLLTHIIAMELINRDNPINVFYMSYLNDMRMLKACSMDNENYVRQQQTYLKATLLIIDDLFKDKFQNGKIIDVLSSSDMRHIMPILDYRYSNNLKTIISTESTIDQLIQLDGAIGWRIIQKCANGKNVVEFKGTKYNYRARKFKK